MLFAKKCREDYTVSVPYLSHMSPIFEMILFYLLLLDAVTANVIAFLGEKWYIRHFRFFARYFPLTK